MNLDDPYYIGYDGSAVIVLHDHYPYCKVQFTHAFDLRSCQF